MFKKLLSLIAVISGLSTPTLAATSTYTVYPTAASIVCGSDAVCSTISHLSVQTVTVSGSAGTALYTWNASCPSSPDAVFYIRPTGATVGCFVLEGFASSVGPGVASVTGTTNQITSSPTTGLVVLSLPSTLIAPGTFSSTSINVSGSTASANGLYLPSANTLGVSVNSIQVSRFTSTGLNATNIGATTPGTGAFTTLSTTGALTYGGVTLSNSVTGTGSMVLSSGAVLAGAPTSPTPTLGDSSTKIATTAFGLGGPSFSAQRTTSTQTFTTATYTKLIYNSAATNVGSAYNTSTGLFAPTVSGTYGCTATVTFNTSGTFTTAENVILALSKNGTIGGTGTAVTTVQAGTNSLLTQSDSVVIPFTVVTLIGGTDTLEVDANVTAATGSPGFLPGFGIGFSCIRISQ